MKMIKTKDKSKYLRRAEQTSIHVVSWGISSTTYEYGRSISASSKSLRSIKIEKAMKIVQLKQ
jgi:hypothetical protein